MIPTDTLVANRAMMSPLMARKAARGIIREPPAGEEHRRPVSPTRHDPGTDHGQPRPGDDQSRHDQQTPGKIGLDLGAGALGMPDDDEVDELGHARRQRHQSIGPRAATA